MQDIELVTVIVIVAISAFVLLPRHPSPGWRAILSRSALGIAMGGIAGLAILVPRLDVVPDALEPTALFVGVIGISVVLVLGTLRRFVSED